MIENINNRLIKDTYFLFERLEFDVYSDSSNDASFLLALPRCSNCNNPWYFNISQCFFCGAIAPFIMKDKNNKYISTTNASRDDRFYPCINPDCLSNDNDINNMTRINKYHGVFDRKSPFNTTLENCIKCGNDYYIYDTALIKINILDEINSMNSNNYDDYDGIIFRFKKEKSIKFLVSDNNNLLKIFNTLANKIINETDFKKEIEKIMNNPE